MAKIIRFMASLILLLGCAPASTLIVAGKITSSKEIGSGSTEHYIETDSPQISSYILKTNKNCFHQGAKVNLELPISSWAKVTY